jgi:site-specific recombinase XerD
MFEKILIDPAALLRHRSAPFADERERYLQHCADFGAAPASLRSKSAGLLFLATHLGPNASAGVDLGRLRQIAKERQSTATVFTAERSLIDVGRPWLKFLGWWRKPIIVLQAQDQLDLYISWMRDERGLTRLTAERWQAHVQRFLRWCDKTDRRLCDLLASDVDAYFIDEGEGRWSRVSVPAIATALRSFLQQCAARGECDPRLPETIRGPRIYAQESLPYGPGWSDVRRLLAFVDPSKAREVRDRAILMLLAIYGLRRGEVAGLRLDQIDWGGRTLRIFRLKRRQEQIYPLVASVAEALAHYIDTVRPPTTSQQIFMTVQAPLRPIASSAIYHVVHRRFAALGIQTPHQGPHALRHACAARLVADGLTLKEIGDHLGHRSTSSTRIYAKVDMTSLCEVGDFDLGDFQ